MECFMFVFAHQTFVLVGLYVNVKPELVIKICKCGFNRIRASICAQVNVLGAPLWLARGLVKFVPAVAYHSCSNCLQDCADHKGVPTNDSLI